MGDLFDDGECFIGLFSISVSFTDLPKIWKPCLFRIVVAYIEPENLTIMRFLVGFRREILSRGTYFRNLAWSILGDWNIWSKSVSRKEYFAWWQSGSSVWLLRFMVSDSYSGSVSLTLLGLFGGGDTSVLRPHLLDDVCSSAWRFV